MGWQEAATVFPKTETLQGEPIGELVRTNKGTKKHSLGISPKTVISRGEPKGTRLVGKKAKVVNGEVSRDHVKSADRTGELFLGQGADAREPERRTERRWLRMGTKGVRYRKLKKNVVKRMQQGLKPERPQNVLQNDPGELLRSPPGFRSGNSVKKMPRSLGGQSP